MRRYPKYGWSVLALGLALLSPSRSAADVVNRAEPDWWLTPRRMNLREIDAGMDVEAYVASLKAAGANVVLFNVGGIVANYPTDLPYHYRNPFLKGDLTGEVVKRLHAEGIRVIARVERLVTVTGQELPTDLEVWDRSEIVPLVAYRRAVISVAK